MSVVELFRKLLPPPPPGLPNSTKLLLRRHHDLRTCIPSLTGTLTTGLRLPDSVRFNGHYSSNLEEQFSKLGSDLLFWLKIFHVFFSDGT
jgi:hypothetical protein